MPINGSKSDHTGSYFDFFSIFAGKHLQAEVWIPLFMENQNPLKIMYCKKMV